MTEMATFTSSSRTWSRRCILACASESRMMDSMCRTAIGTYIHTPNGWCLRRPGQAGWYGVVGKVSAWPGSIHPTRP